MHTTCANGVSFPLHWNTMDIMEQIKGYTKTSWENLLLQQEVEQFLAVGTHGSTNEPKITKTTLLPDSYDGTESWITLKHPNQGIHLLFYILRDFKTRKRSLVSFTCFETATVFKIGPSWENAHNLCKQCFLSPPFAQN
jgi:hypothetical protein